MRALNLPSRFIFFVATYSAYYLLWILSWWLVGKGALEGQLDPGWLMAWVLLLLTLLPFHSKIFSDTINSFSGRRSFSAAIAYPSEKVDFITENKIN